MKGDRLHLEHILKCISKVTQYTVGGREEFLASELIQDGTLYALQTMAESTQRLSEDLKARYPEIDWRALARFRNVIVHHYLGIDLSEVFRAVTEQLPLLRATVEASLRELDDDE